MDDMLKLFAKNNCTLCLGRGVVKWSPVGTDDAVPQICQCARTKYTTYMRNRIKTECPVCKTIGYCTHRPVSLRKALEDLYA